jgi:CRP-like cAMP-binding protein
MLAACDGGGAAERAAGWLWAQQLASLVFKDVPSRLAGLLLQLSQEFGVKSEHGLRLRTNLTHQEMANLIGSTRETVTATLGDFRRAGLVKLDRHDVIVKNPQGLAALSR